MPHKGNTQSIEIRLLQIHNRCRPGKFEVKGGIDEAERAFDTVRCRGGIDDVVDREGRRDFVPKAGGGCRGCRSMGTADTTLRLWVGKGLQQRHRRGMGDV